MSHLDNLDNGTVTTSSEVFHAALGLINMTTTDTTATDTPTTNTITPVHHHHTLAMRDANDHSPTTSLHATKLNLNACIKWIAFLAVHMKLKFRRKYLSWCDYDQIEQMVKRQYDVPSNCNISLKKIHRAMKQFDNEPLIPNVLLPNQSPCCKPHQRCHQRTTKFTLNDTAMLLELPNNQPPSIVGKDVCEILVRSQEALKQNHEFIPTLNIQKSCIELNHFFRHVFDSQAEFGNSNDDPAIVYCYGATGTEKTMTVRHMVHLAKHWTIKKDAAEYDSVHYVNCSSLPMNTSSSKAYDYLLKEYEISELQFRGRGRPRSLDGCTVIILDEIDHIFGQEGLEGMLQWLLDIASKN
jgi:hypothetical protein